MDLANLHSQLILIGGPTGIGKTTMIDNLCKDYPSFSRPISFTTRKRRSKRDDLEYVFVSTSEFSDLARRGKFLTVDKVYTNHYSISLEDFQKKVAENKILIKEVHPSNHQKIKDLFPRTISVGLIPWGDDYNFLNHRNLPEGRRQRLIDDRKYYLETKPSFDIEIEIHSSMSSQRMTKEFLMACVDYCLTRQIEATNRAGYDLIADEFVDSQRITTRNFHELSSEFFIEKMINEVFEDSEVVDLGAGTGYLTNVLSRFKIARTWVVDLSEKMLGQIPDYPKMIKVCGSAFSLPMNSNSVNVVFSSLADPFLIKNGVSEIARILQEGGKFIFSTPSKIWSDSLRAKLSFNSNKTTFVHSSGERASVYSFTYDNSSLRNLLEDNGFKIDDLQVRYGKDLPEDSIVSPALSQGASALGIPFQKLPIIQLVTATKT